MIDQLLISRQGGASTREDSCVFSGPDGDLTMNKDDLVESLQILGQQGWELVAAFDGQTMDAMNARSMVQRTFYFKRPTS